LRTNLTFATLALLVAACAGQPVAPTGGTVAAPSATAAAPAAGTAPAHVDAPRVAGYVRVVKGGTVHYCRNDVQTGSHLIVETTCLTEQEFNALADQTRRDVDRIRNTMTGSTAVSGGH
jgi:hypothetical protein